MSNTEEELFGNTALLDDTVNELEDIPRATVTDDDPDKEKDKSDTEKQEIKQTKSEKNPDKDEEELERVVLEDDDDEGSKNTDKDDEIDLEEELGDKEDFKEDKKDTGDTPSKDSKTASSLYTPYIKALFEEGVLPNLSEEDWTKLKEEHDGDEAKAAIALNKLAVEEAIKEQVNSYKNSHDDELKDLIEAKEKGYSIDELKKIKSEKFAIDKIKEEDLVEDDKLAKRILTKDLRDRGYEESEIEEELELYESADKIGDKAKTALNRQRTKITEKENQIKAQQKEQKKQQEAQYHKQLKSIEESVNKVEEIIPGKKLNKTSREKLYESMTKPAGYDDQGNPISTVIQKRNENPMDFEMKLHYYVMQGLFDGKFDSIKNQQKTSALDDLRKKIESGGTSGGSTRRSRKPSKVDKDLDAGFKSVIT